MKLLRLLSVFCALSFLSLPISAESVYTITETELVTLETNLKTAQEELTQSKAECQKLREELQTVSTSLKKCEEENKGSGFLFIVGLVAGGFAGALITSIGR